jgi:hypothetical protein
MICVPPIAQKSLHTAGAAANATIPADQTHCNVELTFHFRSPSLTVSCPFSLGEAVATPQQGLSACRYHPVFRCWLLPSAPRGYRPPDGVTRCTCSAFGTHHLMNYTIFPAGAGTMPRNRQRQSAASGT